jgi:hypothetical protein
VTAAVATGRVIEVKHPLVQHKLTLLQKLKLYNGKTLPGFTEDNVVERALAVLHREHIEKARMLRNLSA